MLCAMHDIAPWSDPTRTRSWMSQGVLVFRRSFIFRRCGREKWAENLFKVRWYRLLPNHRQDYTSLECQRQTCRVQCGIPIRQRSKIHLKTTWLCCIVVVLRPTHQPKPCNTLALLPVKRRVHGLRNLPSVLSQLSRPSTSKSTSISSFPNPNFHTRLTCCLPQRAFTHRSNLYLVLRMREVRLQNNRQTFLDPLMTPTGLGRIGDHYQNRQENQHFGVHKARPP